MEIETYINLVVVDAMRSIDMHNDKLNFLSSYILYYTLFLPSAMLGYDTANNAEYD